MNLPGIPSRHQTDGSGYSPPIIALLAANIITIILAVLENWDLATVLFIYWAQSIIIGIFAVISILFSDTSTLLADLNKSLADNGRKPTYTGSAVWIYKGAMAGFFTLHYGIFHWAYYSFIVESGIFGPVDLSNWGLWASCFLFFGNHLYSYLYHRRGERQGARFITEAFITPYNRIIPMHLTIIFGSMVILGLGLLGITTVLPVLVLFLIIKTYTDIAMHLRKHDEQENPDSPCRLIGF